MGTWMDTWLKHWSLKLREGLPGRWDWSLGRKDEWSRDNVNGGTSCLLGLGYELLSRQMQRGGMLSVCIAWHVALLHFCDARIA